MGKLNEYKIAWESLSIGNHYFTFEINDDFFSSFDNSEITKGNASAELEVVRQGSMLTLNFVIKGEVLVNCDRCLEDFYLPFEYDGTLYVKFSEDIEEYDGDVMWVSPHEAEIDLGQYIYESIMLSLPYQRIHPEDENGVSGCNPDMLARFSIVSKDEFDDMFDQDEEVTDEQLSEHNRKEFEKLSALKEQMLNEENKK